MTAPGAVEATVASIHWQRPLVPHIRPAPAGVAEVPQPKGQVSAGGTEDLVGI